MQSSKACNTPSIYTSVVPVDSSTQETLPSALEVRSTEGLYSYQQGSRSVSQRHRSYSTGLGRRQDSEDLEDIPVSAELEEIPPSPISISSTAQENQNCPPDAKTSPKPPTNRPSPDGREMAVGTGKEGTMQPCSPRSQSTCSEVLSATVWAQADSGRGSETDVCDHSPDASEASLSLPEISLEPGEGDLESMSWATAVALAWLEHRSAGFFVEWELLAAKADAWLRVQQLPEGVDVAALKGAARQLFLLLRHWDENIKLNMLCYNPNNM
ncbi:hypothetical protein JD844_007997 [Phrynosoma platyrhinos]|uniref:von Willebrand factor A domain containing 5B2 n=1 Tax=Phrynosoma platyrhinos TaxID=52577 RepID=A0ABQ7T3J4_PHRPL|nr:hypothetical protein JD844_007997 [Phrynosoma platyrhinos]